MVLRGAYPLRHHATSDTAVSTAIFQDKKTGKRVRRCGGDSGGFALVKGADNVPYFAALSSLVPCDSEGRPDFEAATTVELEEDEGVVPAPVIEVSETRLNVNTASAEDIARRIPGVGYRTAKLIKDKQTSLPGEVFRSFDQLKAISNRPNWDEILQQNLIFLG